MSGRDFHPGEVIVKLDARGKVVKRYTVADRVRTSHGKLRLVRESGAVFSVWWYHPSNTGSTLPPGHRMAYRAVQPLDWAGMTKGRESWAPMVCGACQDWRKCDRFNRCLRAKPEDYKPRRAMAG